MKKSILIIASLMLLSSTALLSQGKFSGYMFGDYYYNAMRDTSFYRTALSNSAAGSAAPGGENMQAFQFRRIYFTYDNDISEQFTTRFRLEADQVQETVDGTKSPAAASKISVFVKDAYLKWKNVFAGSDLIFGIQPTPAFEISEAAWGYRALEKTILDLRGIVSSRDLGISLKGKLTEDGKLNYWAMIGNNSGNSPEIDKYKRYYAHLQLKLNDNLQATLYTDYKDAAKVIAGENSTWTTALFAGYAVPFMYNIGVEGYATSQSNAFTPTGGSLGSKNGLGISMFCSYNIIPELAAVARYDYFDPNTNSSDNAKGDVRNYVIVGLSWKVDKNVSIMPNVLYEKYEAPLNHGEPDPSITARVTLYYVFL
jgi:hypothetical protein